ncbi:MAG: regulatory iron-sulfur-containing complex subunit RicT [Myxococcota bacterium]
MSGVGNPSLTLLDDTPAPVEIAGRYQVEVSFSVPGSFELFESAIELRAGDEVVAESERGLDVGTVLRCTALTDEIGRRILRRINPEDERQRIENRAREHEAFAFCQERIRAHKLPMRLVGSELTLSGTRLTLYFTCDDRVDFRVLVRDLAGRFHTRIELRQIGIRDAARHTGGIGVCGRTLCCSTFLPSFAPISIRMAKDQNLALQHEQLAGYCGRLRCCLQYEHALYKERRAGLPKLGKRVLTPDGEGRVRDVDVLRGRVRVQLNAGGFVEVGADALTVPDDVRAQQDRQRGAEAERQGGAGESKSAKRRRRRKKKTT